MSAGRSNPVSQPGGLPSPRFTIPANGSLIIPKGIPAPLDRICDREFAEGTGISDLDFAPDCTISLIESQAFWFSAIRRLVLPASLTTLGPKVFEQTPELIKVESRSKAFIGDSVFLYNATKTELVFCERNHSGKVVIAPTITKIWPFTFQGCRAITEIQFASPSKLTEIGDGAFAQTGLQKLSIPPSVVNLGEAFLQEASQLAEITFSDSRITKIPKLSFDGTAIQKLIVPKSVTSLGSQCFSRVYNLKQIEFEAGSALDTIDSEVFWGAGITELTLPQKLVNLHGDNFFQTDQLDKINVSRNAHFILIDSLLMDDAKLVVHVACRKIQNAVIPPTVTQIRGFAFFNCLSLQTVVFPAPSELTNLGTAAFTGSTIKAIVIPASLTEICADCFADCRSLESVTFAPESLCHTVGYRAFGRSGIRRFDAPTRLNTLGSLAFANSAIQEATFYYRLEQVEFLTFFECTALTKVQFASPKIAFVDDPFEGASSSLSIYLADGVPAPKVTGKVKTWRPPVVREPVLGRPHGPSLPPILKAGDRLPDPTWKPKTRGAYAEVFKLVNKHNDAVSAGKTFKYTDGLTFPDFLEEMEILRACCHPCVLGVIGFTGETTDDPKRDTWTLITEWMPRGSLAEFLYGKAGRLDLNQKVKIVAGIVMGMRYIHKCNVVHADLKPQNILLSDDFEVRIADFGSARSIDFPTPKPLTTSPAFQAPELSVHMGPPCDVFAFGVLVWELLTGKEAQRKPNDDMTFPGVAGPATELLKKCCERNVTKRATFDRVFDELKAKKWQTFGETDARAIAAYVEEIEKFERDNPPHSLKPDE
jgi:hypothetical protein